MTRLRGILMYGDAEIRRGVHKRLGLLECQGWLGASELTPIRDYA